jgi:hypothetical protein
MLKDENEKKNQLKKEKKTQSQWIVVCKAIN